jgi:hypothetical protein
LFEVQEWIAAGKPVNPPPSLRKGNQPRSPLRIAIELGFHSLVLVLLRGGATIEPDSWSGSMRLALRKKRSDLARLLVEHGCDPAGVDMVDVFETWDSALMDFFVERGGDLSAKYPVARALCRRIRTALRVCVKYKERFPSVQDQMNVALRCHCVRKNLKWASLMLWAGADPYAPAVIDFEDGDFADHVGGTAVHLAAIYKFFEFFDLKQVALNVDHPEMKRVVASACTAGCLSLIEKDLERGFVLNDRENGGSSVLRTLLLSLDWLASLGEWSHFGLDAKRGADSSQAREAMDAVRFLADKGARWAPRDKEEITEVRRVLVKLAPKYTAEFILVMARCGGCSKADVVELIGTPAMKARLEPLAGRLERIVSGWPSPISP